MGLLRSEDVEQCSIRFRSFMVRNVNESDKVNIGLSLVGLSSSKYLASGIQSSQAHVELSPVTAKL